MHGNMQKTATRRETKSCDVSMIACVLLQSICNYISYQISCIYVEMHLYINIYSINKLCLDTTLISNRESMLINFSKRTQGLRLVPPWHLPWWPPLRSRRRPPWRATPGNYEFPVGCRCSSLCLLLFTCFSWSYPALQIQTELLSCLQSFKATTGVSRNSFGTRHVDLMQPPFGCKIFTARLWKFKEFMQKGKDQYLVESRSRTRGSRRKGICACGPMRRPKNHIVEWWWNQKETVFII